MVTTNGCANCGAHINYERDLDPIEMASFKLHLQACALEVAHRQMLAIEKIAASPLLAEEPAEIPSDGTEIDGGVWYAPSGDAEPIKFGVRE